MLHSQHACGLCAQAKTCDLLLIGQFPDLCCPAGWKTAHCSIGHAIGTMQVRLQAVS